MKPRIAPAMWRKMALLVLSLALVPLVLPAVAWASAPPTELGETPKGDDSGPTSVKGESTASSLDSLEPARERQDRRELVERSRLSYRCAIGAEKACVFGQERLLGPEADLRRLELAPSPGKGAVPAPVAELLTITAEVAIKRAKQNGLSFLHDRIESTVCKLARPAIAHSRSPADEAASSKAKVPLFPATCRLLGDASLEELAADPRRLQAPLVEDLIAIARDVGWQYLDQAAGADAPGVAAAVRLTMELALQARARQRTAPAASEAIALVRLMLAQRCTVRSKSCTGEPWGQAKAIPLALEGIAVFLADDGTQDIATVILQILDEPEPDPELLARATSMAALGIRALGLDGRRTEQPDHEAWLAAVTFVLEIARESVHAHAPDTRPFNAIVDHIEDLLRAIADENTAAGISAAAQLVLAVIERQEGCADELGVAPAATAPPPGPGAPAPERPRGEQRKAAADERRDRCSFPPSLEKATAMLTALASYSTTYVEVANDGKTEAERHADRTAALEGMIDAATRRSNREGDWVFGLGLPVGFAVGGQRFLHDNPDGLRTSAMTPQLELPLGFGVQRLVGKRTSVGKAPADRKWRWDGMHAFASMLDLGQFAAYDPNGELARPRWDSILSPGLQLGWVIGTPANSFVVGAEARYAPTLFAGSSSLTVPEAQPGGVVRFGLVLAYYVPLFDFN